MRTGAIFARGSCRALKWMALFGVVFALLATSSETALAQEAQTLTKVEATISGPRTIGEGDEATFTVKLTGEISARDARTTGADNLTSTERTVTVVVGVATSEQQSATTGEFNEAGQPNDGAIVTNANVRLTFDANTGSTARSRTATGDVTFRTNADDDAEDEVVFLRINTVTTTGDLAAAVSPLESGGVGGTAKFTIEDAQTQTYEVSLNTVTHTSINPPKEGADISVNLKAVPKHHDDGATITLYVDGEDGKPAEGYAALGAGSATGSSLAAIGTTNPTAGQDPLSTAVNTRAITISQSHNATNGDGNRVPDTIVLRAFTGAGRNAELADTVSINVRDEHGLPAADAITAVAKNEDGEEIEALVEGGAPVFLTVTVDRGRGTFITDEALEVEIRPADPMQVTDYDLTGGRVTLEERTSGKQTNDRDDKIKLSARSDDEDVGPEELVLNLVVSGSDSGKGRETSTGTFSIPITDMTTPLVSVKDGAYDAIKAQRGGDDEPLNPGDSFSVMTDDLFAYDPMAVTVSIGISVEGPAVTATASGEAVTVAAAGAGESKVTVIAKATPKSSSLVVTQTESDEAQLTFPVNVVLADLSVMVAANPMEVMEGASTMLTATANREVTEDTMIGLVVVGDEDAYTVADAITIASGTTSGSVELMASQDDDYMDETLTVIASGPGIDGSVQIEIMVTDNDEAPVDEPTVTAKTQEQVDAVFAAAIAEARTGSDWNTSDGPATVDMSKLFNVAENASPAYAGSSNNRAAVSETASGAMLTLSPMAAGTATITVTASDSASGDIATAAAAVTVVNLPLVVTVSTVPMDGGMVEEGGTIAARAIANRALLADEQVAITLTITGPVEMNKAMIEIASGEDMGTATIQVLDDNEVAPMADITIVATGDVLSEPVTSTISVTENDSPRTFTLSGPADMNLVEGKEYELTVTADPEVSKDTEVMVMLDRAASTAGADDYEVGSITIAAGEASGSTMLTVAEDGMDDSGSGMPEMLVLYAMADNTQSNTLEFNIWDAAVPALPVIAQLLLAAFLAIGGYRRYLRR